MTIENTQLNNRNSFEKEKQREYIEKILSEFSFENTNPNEYLKQLWISTKRSVQARVAYEILKKYEEDPNNTVVNYDIQEAKNNTGGIYIDLEKISKDVWVPRNLTDKDTSWKEFFNVFNQDENNVFAIFPQEDMKENGDLKIIKNVLYCIDENNKSIGKKVDLFLNNPNWRNLAKNYSILLLKYMNIFYSKMLSKELDPNDKLYIFKKDNNKEEEKYLKTIISVTDLYLNEMK